MGKILFTGYEVNKSMTNDSAKKLQLNQAQANLLASLCYELSDPQSVTQPS